MQSNYNKQKQTKITMKNVFIYLLAFGALVTSVSAITSKNPVISVIYLIATFVQLAGVLVLLGINFVGISYIVVYVGSIAVLFLFVIMMINVRLCAYATRETISFNSYSDRIITTELGQRGKPKVELSISV
jgi:NADH:ubiquinone oxidoreductase subunit 6 (subunit J)